jgi:hypothetical protein
MVKISKERKIKLFSFMKFKFIFFEKKKKKR